MNVNKVDSTINLYTEATGLNKWLLVPSYGSVSTPLMKAVYDRAMETLQHKPYTRETQLSNIELLLARGADVNIAYTKGCSDKDAKFNESMLKWALVSKDLELTMLLMKYGAQKYYKFDQEKMILIKEKFSTEETIIYKQVKKRLKDDQISLVKNQAQTFLLGLEDENSAHNKFPKEIVTHILTSGHSSGRAVSSNQKQIDEAKKMINENLKQEAMLDMKWSENSGHTLMLSNY